jgi:hypothetical protein
MHESFLPGLESMPHYISMFKSSKQDQAELSLPQITDLLALEDVAFLTKYHVEKEL